MSDVSLPVPVSVPATSITDTKHDGPTLGLIVAGNVLSACIDGIGVAASFNPPRGICYSTALDVLLIAEAGPTRCAVRRLLPGSAKRKAEIDRTLTSVLVESGALPIQPLIPIVRDFALPTSTVRACRPLSFSRSLWLLRRRSRIQNVL